MPSYHAGLVMLERFSPDSAQHCSDRTSTGIAMKNRTILIIWRLVVLPCFVMATARSQTGVALVRHAPVLNGAVDGSVQQMSGESVTLDGNAAVTGDLLVPGTPTVRLNGKPDYGGTTDGNGDSSPTNYAVTITGGAKVRHVVRRTNALSMPQVDLPSGPAGTRDVTITSTNDAVGGFTTLRNLNVGGDAGLVDVPPGAYGQFTAGSSSGFSFGVSGTTQPTVYNFQSLTVNGGAQLRIVGPVIINVASGLTVSGRVGYDSSPPG